jgi:alanyl-tRNA synthetase
MTAKELRRSYIEFFKSKGHSEIKSASLVPENDPTVLFTTAGMHPLVPYLMGQPHPSGIRLVNYQKCIRTGDIEEVGDDVHLTFFEMLGNWSLGDYFKQEAIEFSFEYLTSSDYLNLPVDRLAFSVFAGDDDAPLDQESLDKWQSLGVAETRIAKLPKKDNWWGPAGHTGPCGPDTEMFYWTGDGAAPETFDSENKQWVEIWNDVFMQYNKTADGTFEPLTQMNVDTGMGVERVTAILQGCASCYDTELFTPLFDRLKELSGHADPRQDRSGRVVAEHLRSATFILATDITPSNLGQGYILRRLIRRAVREGRRLGIATGSPFCTQIGEVVIKEYCDIYPELAQRNDVILKELELEEEQFAAALERGEREFNKMVDKFPPQVEKKIISGRKAFDLYQTYGFPLELTVEMAGERDFTVDETGYNKAFEKHQAASRLGAEDKFKGGLQDHSEHTTRLHTATHLLHQALRDVLGDHVAQKGSNITADRLRFDFSHPEKVTKEQLTEVEAIVNKHIEAGHPVSRDEMTVDEAKTGGAIGLFEERYGERISVYTIGDYSKEICGGPHVENTNKLGSFKVKKEESSSRGVRRIKAVLS